MKKIMTLVLTAVLSTAVFAGCAPKAEEAVADKATENETTAVTKGDETKKAILVVSFGTSYNDTRENTITAIEKKIAAEYPDYDVRRAFTSQIIIDKLAKRDNLVIDNVTQAMDRLVADGFGTVICQPTHVMNGLEYDDMFAEVSPYEEKIQTIKFGTPLLTSVEDYQSLVEVVNAEMPKLNAEEALVFMGHGTSHFANATYSALDYKFKDNGNKNVFIGTVESYPDLDTVVKQVKESGAKKVYLAPLMIVAGDHATNDMAGDEEGSWKTKFKSEGFEVEVILKGLGEYSGVQDMYVKHVGTAIAGEVLEEEAAAE